MGDADVPTALHVRAERSRSEGDASGRQAAAEAVGGSGKSAADGDDTMRLTRERTLLLVLLTVAAAVWWLAWGEANNALRITVLDVGQGDCILIQAPAGRTMLVDGGGPPGQQASGY